MLCLALVVALGALAGCAERDDGAGANVEDRLLNGTDEIRPGMFTEFEGGILVGAHPHAVEEPLAIDVEFIDPTDPGAATGAEAFEAREPDIEEMGPFVEVSVEDADRALEAETFTQFFVALPVPDDLDADHLALLEYAGERYEFPPGPGHEEARLEDAWTWASGRHDADLGLYVTQLNRIGGSENPTRLGLVEHSRFETDPEWATGPRHPTLEVLATQHFPRVEEEPWPPDGGPHEVPENDTGTARIQSHAYQEYFDTDFGISCTAADCNATIVDESRDALDHAQDRYTSLLNGNPTPDLPTVTLCKTPDPSSIICEPAWEYNIRDYASDEDCEAPGYHSPSAGSWDGTAVTCLTYKNDTGSVVYPRGDNATTSAHELVHATQHAYYDVVGYQSDEIVVEATAKLAEEWETPGRATAAHPNGLPNITEPMREGAYPWEHFYAHLIAANADVWFGDLGDLFASNLEYSGLEDWLGWGGLRTAYWDFVKDTVFEQDHPTVESSFLYGGQPDPCNIDPFVDSRSNDFAHEIDIDKRTEPSSEAPVHPEGAVEWRISDPPELSTHVVELSLPSWGYDPYMATIEVEIWGEDPMHPSNWMAQVYDARAADYEPCSTDPGDELQAWDEGKQAAVFEIPVYGKAKTVYVLHAELDDTEDTFQPKVTFEPVPEEEVPYPVAGNLTVPYPPDPDDHDGSVTFDLPVEDPDDEDLLSLSTPGVSTDAGNDASVSDENGFTMTYELDREHRTSPGSIEDGRYTDVVAYKVTNERYGIGSEGAATVERDLNPIAYEVNHSIDWGLEAIDPLEPKPGPVCGFDENTADVNPIDYDGSPFNTQAIRVHDAWGANPNIGDVSVNEDETTVAYKPVDDTEGWSYEAPGGDEFQTTPPCQLIDTFQYEVRNVLHVASKHGADQAQVNLYRAEGAADGPGVPPTTTDWLDVVFDLLDSREAPGVALGHADGLREGAIQILALDEDRRRTAYLQPGADADWIDVGQRVEGDLAVTDLNAEGLVAGWVDDGNELQAVTSDRGEAPEPLQATGESLALALNDAGLVAGHALLGHDQAPRAVVWAEEVPYAIDDALEGRSLATDLNDARQVVGIHAASPVPGGLSNAPIDPRLGVLESLRSDVLADGVQGFLYEYRTAEDPSVGTVKELGSLGGAATVPMAVNDEGTVVGASTLDPDDPRTFHAFYWQDGAMHEIDPPAEAERSVATGVNEDGYVVGTYERSDGASRGFLWHPQEGFVDLDDRALVHDDWTLVEATDIDDEGRVQVLVQVTEDARWPMTLSVPI